MKAALVVRADRDAAAEVAAIAAGQAADRGIEIVPPELEAEPDLVVAVGGDGTVLEAVQLGLAVDAAIVGVNVGRVGFLADLDPEELPDLWEAAAVGEWDERAHMTVEAQLHDGTRLSGINDVVVEKLTSRRLVSLEVSIDGERFLTYRADGIVVATPLGSTAYSMSAGGPLVDPAVDALLITPVAPSSLFDSSLVLSPQAEVTCRVVHDRPAGVNVDSTELGDLAPGQEVVIRRGARRARFVDLRHQAYGEKVKAKLRLYGGLDGA